MQEVALHPTHFMATVLNMNANRWMSSAEMIAYAKSQHIRLDTTSVASTQTILNSAANQSKINFEKKTELKTILYRLTETGISLIKKGWIKIITNTDFTRTPKHEQTPNTTAETLQEMMKEVCYSPYEDYYPSDDSNDEDYGEKGNKRKRAVYHNPDERRMINVALQVLHFENRSMAPGDIHKRAYEIDIEVPRTTNTKLLARSMKHSDFFIRERNVGHAYFSLSATGVQAAKQLAKENNCFDIDYENYETECSVLSVETSTVDTIICECSEYVEADDNEIQLMVECSTCNKTMFVSYKNDYLERKKQGQSQLASINTTKRTIAQVNDAENEYSHKRQKLSQEPISRTPVLA